MAFFSMEVFYESRQGKSFLCVYNYCDTLNFRFTSLRVQNARGNEIFSNPRRTSVKPMYFISHSNEVSLESDPPLLNFAASPVGISLGRPFETNIVQKVLKCIVFSDTKCVNSAAVRLHGGHHICLHKTPCSRWSWRRPRSDTARGGRW